MLYSVYNCGFIYARCSTRFATRRSAGEFQVANSLQYFLKKTAQCFSWFGYVCVGKLVLFSPVNYCEDKLLIAVNDYVMPSLYTYLRVRKGR